MTACVIFSPRYFSASAFILPRTNAEICCGAYCSVLSPICTSTYASPFLPSTTLNGMFFASSRISENLRPIRRLAEKMVLRGLVTAWRFAAWPTTRSPVFVNATTDGVVRPPSAFGTTTGSPPSMIAMQEFVVPKSMPRMRLMTLLPAMTVPRMDPLY